MHFTVFWIFKLFGRHWWEYSNISMHTCNVNSTYQVISSSTFPVFLNVWWRMAPLLPFFQWSTIIVSNTHLLLKFQLSVFCLPIYRLILTPSSELQCAMYTHLSVPAYLVNLKAPRVTLSALLFIMPRENSQMTGTDFIK